MSRIGKKPIPVPAGVQVDINGARVRVTGPKGELEREFSPDMSIALEAAGEASQVVVTRPTEQPRHRALHGLTRALLANMVTGVTDGFKRDLTIDGTGYRGEVQGQDLVLLVGYSHPVRFVPPSGISFAVDRTGRSVSVLGSDKELVGEIAARIRRVRPPEPYLGKGIRYADERIRRKAGKTGR
jgi:large subunit ribosomal protein L6